MQMLLDPFEEQFHVPTFAVEFCYGQSFVSEMVGQETVDVTGGEVFIGHHPQVFGITLSGLVCGEFDDLVSHDSGVLVNRIGLDDIVLHIVLCPRNEERSVLVYTVEETEEVDISLVHQIDGSHLNAEFIQHPDIMYGSICEIDKCGDITTKIEKRMHLHTGLSGSELCPGAELQTKTDCATVKGIDSIVKIQSEGRVVSIKRSHFIYESLPEVSIDAPITEFVCLSQSVARNRVTDTAHIQLVGDCRQTCFDIPEAVLIRVLSHAHNQELVIAGEVPDTIVPIVAGNAIVELTSWNKGHNLGKYCASLVHRGNDSGLCRKAIDSNRVHRNTGISS